MFYFCQIYRTLICYHNGNTLTLFDFIENIAEIQNFADFSVRTLTVYPTKIEKTVGL